MRTIDADEPLSRLAMFSDRENGNEHFLNGIETAKEIIDSTPTISPAANWTPCSVALPENDGAYEVTFLLDDGRRRTTTAIFVAATKTWTDDILKIVAWKERTEPYRGEVE